MNTLNLKLQESVNDITLPKIEEIVLEFIGAGSKVFQIEKQGQIPFEVISGSVTTSLELHENSTALMPMIAQNFLIIRLIVYLQSFRIHI